MRSGLELAGRYRLESPLGRGGMGEVWRGVDQRLRRPVAVKLLPGPVTADTTGVARFRREAEVAAGLNHPGITTVLDIDEHRDGDERLLFLVMELMEGRNLASVLAGHPGGVPVDQAVDWAAQILDALAAAHRSGAVHRDIKPANLFLVDGGRVKICDFGIARLADATRLTATGGSAGTPLYMAPEQIEGHDVDQRTDLYSFGCVLHELLTGTSWLDTGSGVGSVLYQHLNQAPAPPRTLRPDIPEPLNDLVLALLAKRPEDRPADAAAAAGRLRATPAHVPAAPALASAPPPASPQPLQVPAQPVAPPPQFPPAVPAGPGHWQPPSAARLPFGPHTQPPAVRGGTGAAGFTALASAVLVAPCLLWVLFAIFKDLEFISEFPGDGAVAWWWLHLAVSALEGVPLGLGALLLLARRAAGRWLITGGGVLVVLQTVVTIAMFAQLTGELTMETPVSVTYLVIAPVLTLPAAAAALLAALPPTGHWCRRQAVRPRWTT
ncbi:serine/threonine-protein kinase [Actinomadura rupiterrae]|uniref:serine/threonine-protein kinase n=1 Tax=Actinomadura rupiterrae TaxID=559627 RepID=UPI0020A2BAA0|nr:serine/threonine-protein kinase [Actinomadura rupiterrae]MCP2343547.1 hypothetical protein [Actinomadura rupiterrae]